MCSPFSLSRGSWFPWADENKVKGSPGASILYAIISAGPVTGRTGSIFWNNRFRILGVGHAVIAARTPA